MCLKNCFSRIFRWCVECNDGCVCRTDEMFMRFQCTTVQTKTVDIFIPVALAWGVRSAKGKLKKALEDPKCAVGWGNTNLSAREYKSALRIAHEVGRPVEFAC